MANVQIIGGAFKIDGANAYILSGAHITGVATKVIQLVGSSPVGLSITVKGRVAGSGNTPVAIPYRKRYLNGAVGDDTLVSTAITSDSLIEVNVAGLDVVLDNASYTSGSFAVTTKDLVG
jgi:hypothetical protein